MLRVLLFLMLSTLLTSVGHRRVVLHRNWPPGSFVVMLAVALIFTSSAAQARNGDQNSVVQDGGANLAQRVEISIQRDPRDDRFFREVVDLYRFDGFMNTDGGDGDVPAIPSVIQPTTPAADKNTNTKRPCSSPSSGSPVKLATGEKHLTHVDPRTAGIYGLEFSRTYRSGQRIGRMFGPNWLSSYEPAHAEPSTAMLPTQYGPAPAWVVILQPDGTRFTYNLDEVYD